MSATASTSGSDLDSLVLQFCAITGTIFFITYLGNSTKPVTVAQNYPFRCSHRLKFELKL